jgi:hypothetical protein
MARPAVPKRCQREGGPEKDGGNIPADGPLAENLQDVPAAIGQLTTSAIPVEPTVIPT